MKGYSNAAIAAQLNITTGGVKNHKLRLYERLDITTERELISAVLSHL
ncbi:LuxR C-terminal-related transcriptional regulator (plasmid) [Shinella sp. B3.7]|uniref:LuxR C-terminal-related transcriptional regulator n=1 Tax=Shinella sedimenti TaxID=2919913 RepID=A0ABT0CRP6_9HYPH|nr:LuxR C-terminal-related transcriptional regulator [Shinella sedimenti]